MITFFLNSQFLLCPFLFVAESATPSSTSDSNSQRSFNELNRAIRREVTRLSEQWSNLILQADRWQTKVCVLFSCTTDNGRPMKPFFIEIPNFWAWADNLVRQILGYFRLFYQHPFWYCESLFH